MTWLLFRSRKVLKETDEIVLHSRNLTIRRVSLGVDHDGVFARAATKYLTPPPAPPPLLLLTAPPPAPDPPAECAPAPPPPDPPPGRPPIPTPPPLSPLSHSPKTFPLPPANYF